MDKFKMRIGFLKMAGFKNQAELARKIDYDGSSVNRALRHGRGGKRLLKAIARELKVDYDELWG